MYYLMFVVKVPYRTVILSTDAEAAADETNETPDPDDPEDMNGM